MPTYTVSFYNVGTRKIVKSSVKAADAIKAETLARSTVHLTAGQWVVIEVAFVQEDC